MALVSLIPPCAPAHAETGPDGESGVKAEMLYNIAKFIRWPETTFAASDGHMVFAILGEDELAGVVASTLSTRTVNGRPVYVRFIRRAHDVRGSHIFFISTSEAGRVAELLPAVRNTPVLTIADTHGFVAAGGMVDFIREDGRVRFEIHPARAERAGLKISAKLLALARVVDSAP
jgi:hypothetical protein